MTNKHPRVCYDCGSTANETRFPRRRPNGGLSLCDDCLIERAPPRLRALLAATRYFRHARQADLFAQQKAPAVGAGAEGEGVAGLVEKRRTA
jgi:hypothetical protein